MEDERGSGAGEFGAAEAGKRLVAAAAAAEAISLGVPSDRLDEAIDAENPVVAVFTENLQQSLAAYAATGYIEQRYGAPGRETLLPLSRASHDFKSLESEAWTATRKSMKLRDVFEPYRVALPKLRWLWLRRWFPGRTSGTKGVRSPMPPRIDNTASERAMAAADSLSGPDSPLDNVRAMHRAAQEMCLAWDALAAIARMPDVPWPSQLAPDNAARINRLLDGFGAAIEGMLRARCAKLAASIAGDGLELIVTVNSQPFDTKDRFELQLDTYNYAMADDIAPGLRADWVARQCALDKLVEVIGPGPRLAFVRKELTLSAGRKKKLEAQLQKWSVAP